MVFVLMFRGKSLLSFLLVSSLSVGCLSRKKDDSAAVEAAPPPPAAYPTTPAGYAESGSMAPAPPSSAGPAPAAPEPAEFQLREGETLVSYRIEPGDYLSKIAAKYNTSVSRIKAANGMTDDRIYAGKSLQIPTAAPPGLALNAAAAAPAPSAGSSSYGSPYGVGSATGAASAPSPGATSYPSITDPAPAASPSATSYPPVPAPPIPPQTQQPAGAFPTPSFGGGGVQFSN